VTTFFLIRHGENDFVGKKIAGRSPGVHLNAEGKKQAEQLAEKLSRESIQKIFSSPLERTMETARPLSDKTGLKIETSPALIEIDFGDWTGLEFDQLEKTPNWREWNLFRSTTRIPNGEMMTEVEARMVAELQRIRVENRSARIAIFSHGDPIRAALMHFLGMPLDFVHRLEISPASISVLTLDDFGAQICRLNELVD
jgi:probable phosphoglycerate mutase